MKNLVITLSIIIVVLVNTVHGQRASCSAYPKCSTLTGNCCPTNQGTYLDCCGGSKPIPKVVIKPVTKPIAKPHTVGRRCLAHDKCKHLSGFCCPTSQGVYLTCCPKTKRYLSHQQNEQTLDETLLATTETEKANEIPISRTNQDSNNSNDIDNNRILKGDAKCSSTSACSKLTGNCCPTSAGKYLDCCKSTKTPPPKKSTSRSCSANPKCKNLSGNCCPTTSGTYLSCCQK